MHEKWAYFMPELVVRPQKIKVFGRPGGGYCGLVKMPNEIWLGYAGTLGISYNLPLVFEAMKRVNDNRLRFIIMGDGPLRRDFELMSSDLNVVYTGRLEYSQMCGVLTVCDAVVNPIIGSSVASIINKHADYAACGKAVINTQNSEEYKALIDEYKMGINCDSSEKNDMENALRWLVQGQIDWTRMGENARMCAESVFDRKKTYIELRKVIVQGK